MWEHFIVMALLFFIGNLVVVAYLALVQRSGDEPGGPS